MGDFETECVEEDSNPSSVVDSSNLYPDENLTTLLYPEYLETTVFASVTVLFSRFARSDCTLVRLCLFLQGPPQTQKG